MNNRKVVKKETHERKNTMYIENTNFIYDIDYIMAAVKIIYIYIFFKIYL